MDEGRQLRRDDLATEKICVWEAVLPGALLPVWLMGVRRWAWREDCWNEAATPWPGGLAERGGISRRGAKWPRGRMHARGRTSLVLSCRGSGQLQGNIAMRHRAGQLRRGKLNIKFRSRAASPKKHKISG